MVTWPGKVLPPNLSARMKSYHCPPGQVYRTHPWPSPTSGSLARKQLSTGGGSGDLGSRSGVMTDGLGETSPSWASVSPPFLWWGLEGLSHHPLPFLPHIPPKGKHRGHTHQCAGPLLDRPGFWNLFPQLWCQLKMSNYGGAEKPIQLLPSAGVPAQKSPPMRPRANC